jgi:hypothetical protein
MSYSTESDVYDETGLTSAWTQQLTGKNAADVTTLINNFIADADDKINKRIGIPITVHRELHKGTGEDDEFDLCAEDEFGFFEEYDPANNTVEAFACYFDCKRKKRPYPKDCDQTESIASACAVSNAAVTDETTIVACGSNSLRAVFSAAGWVRYPDISSQSVLNKNIDIFDFVSFRIRCSSAAVNLTLRLYDRDGNYCSVTFAVDRADNWFVMHFDIDSDFTYPVAFDWDDTKLWYWELHADGACTVYFDNLNFNDEWFITAPQGKFCIAHRIDYLQSAGGSRAQGEEPPPDGYEFYVTYSVNPFLSSVPQCIAEASAKLAGVKLIDHLIGVRERNTAFLVEGDTLITAPDRETMYHTRSRLISEAKQCIADYGYGFEFTPVDA